MDKSGTTVFVVDDDASVRRSMARLLHAVGYEVATLPTAEEYLQMRRGRSAGCLVLDLQMPGLNGLELQKALAAEDREIPIVFVSGQAHIPDSVQAMRLGAVDFLTKPFDEEEFLSAIDQAIRKDLILRKTRTGQRSVQRRVELLTPREREVLSQVLLGRLNKQVAFNLGISEKTVKVHRARVMEKMRAGSVAELVRLCGKLEDERAVSRVTAEAA